MSIHRVTLISLVGAVVVLIALGYRWADKVGRGQLIGSENAALACLAASPESREAAFIAAVTGFERQPFSARNVADSQEELRRLIAARAGDEIEVRARYALGRSYQLYSRETALPSNPETAGLVNDSSRHFLAQLTTIKFMLQQLYRADTDESEATRLAAAEGFVSHLEVPGLLVEYHLLLGGAYLFFGDQRSPALAHLLKAEQLDIPDSAARANLLVQIGELARLEGKNALAADAYRKFLNEFSHDVRVSIVQERLREVGTHSHEAW